ncbi:hypothetical protein NVS55_38425 [Myxococcus stipitatus]|uniref:hypothetical protein n=1 Tax=Myxococcus stipitatus TaxID=83455 RepID=UPI0031454121
MPFDINRFRAEKRYRNTAPVAELMGDLGYLARFDTEIEALRNKWRGRASAASWVCGLLFVALLAIGFAGSDGEESGGQGPYWAGWGVTLVLAVGLHLRANKYSRQDLENRRYGLLSQLLLRLRRDIEPEEPVTLELDFRAVDHPDKWTEKGRAGRWTTNEFEDPWMSLHARLRDGTHLRLSMEEWLQKRTRTKVNARGKHKTKQKQKSATFLQAQLRVKPERHPGLASLQDTARQSVRLPPKVLLSKLEVAEDRLSLRARMESDWVAVPVDSASAPDATRTCLMMLLSLYQVLNHSHARQGKKLSARASS